MNLGASVSWNQAVATITSDEKLDASGIKEYYKPLQEFLKRAN